ncbi:hypothetical protein CXU21_03225 [Akkermansia muciniphila]|nr:hypothetical protein CXU21_03225 [Akkermansia muciniphila]
MGIPACGAEDVQPCNDVPAAGISGFLRRRTREKAPAADASVFSLRQVHPPGAGTGIANGTEAYATRYRM